MRKGVRILSLFLFSLVIVSVFATLVSAPDTSSSSGSPAQIIFQPIKDLFTNWSLGQLDVNIAKYFFLILITLLIWSILDTTGFIPSNPVRVLISFVVGFLATAYFTPEQVWLTLMSYTTLGLVMLFFFPLFIIFFFTIRIIIYGGAKGVLFQYIIWIGYFFFSIGVFISGVSKGKIQVDSAESWLFFIPMLLAVIMLIFNRAIIRWIGAEWFNAEVGEAENTMRRATELRRMESEALGRQAERVRRRR